MTVERVSFVLPVADMTKAVELWSALLGIEPTFVDGARWAQFDLDGSRIGLAGTDRETDRAAPMVKVTNLAAAADVLRAREYSVAEVTVGPHERRVVATSPDNEPLILYTSLPK